MKNDLSVGRAVEEYPKEKRRDPSLSPFIFRDISKLSGKTVGHKDGRVGNPAEAN